MARRYHPRRVRDYYAHTLKPHGPVEWADQRTSMADAYTALCLHAGVDIDDIDPSDGLDYSRRQYDAVRDSWQDLIEQHGISDWATREMSKTFERWSTRRPQFTDDDNWLKLAEQWQLTHVDRKEGRHG
ncbi:hypothetical protein [Streptomyces sp. NPDC002994]|uniref:hypothetical protein n=1 Tax=Streptomyces sp. NPDC002994 TaxID=3154441 RepID=UPI0033B01EFD